ncbi:MAG: Gfo/Idh/MocA family oxidoreductase, partial [Proteobacteria bacterium]|nr:Gfo/Idh/MocA family oxidoreductase [Pseudomonadota bacterium]
GLEVRSQRTVWLKEPSLEGRLTSDLRPPTSVSIGLIGAGNFTGARLLPALKKTGARLKTIASSGGVSGTHLGKKFGFEESTTDANTIFSNPEINAVFITTQHNTHAGFVMQALEADKHVFVEKPLCISQTELEEIIKVYSDLRPPTSDFRLLMVGFNRRFSAHIIKMKELLETVRKPKSMIMTVNAGMIPVDHWTQDSEVGGGRIIGEACHFIDLLRFLVGEKIVKYDKAVMQSRAGDTLSINLSFADGSIGTVHYFANGNKSFPKERLEVFCGEKILQLDNFKVLRGCGWKGFKKMKLWRQDKGHRNEIRSFVNAVEHGNPSPIPFEEIIEVTKISLELAVDKRR